MTSPAARSPNRQKKFWSTFDFPKAGKAATCLVTCDTNANMVDANTVTLDDGIRKVVYEYDKSANGVAAGNVNWAAGTTAATVAANLRTAIIAQQTSVTVTDNADGTLSLTHNWVGAGGNAAGNAKSSASALAITAWAGGRDAAGNTLADETTKLHKVNGRAIRLTRVMLNLPAGLAAHASNYVNFKLLKGASTVIANWSTQTGQQGTVTADTPVEMVLTATVADQHLADGDQLSLFTDVTGTPTVPPGRISIEGTEQ